MSYFKEWAPLNLYNGKMLKLCMEAAADRYDYSYE
jgi:hypothetical protein